MVGCGNPHLKVVCPCWLLVNFQIFLHNFSCKLLIKSLIFLEIPNDRITVTAHHGHQSSMLNGTVDAGGKFGPTATLDCYNV